MLKVPAERLGRAVVKLSSVLSFQSVDCSTISPAVETELSVVTNFSGFWKRHIQWVGKLTCPGPQTSFAERRELSSDTVELLGGIMFAMFAVLLFRISSIPRVMIRNTGIKGPLSIARPGSDVAIPSAAIQLTYVGHGKRF